MKYLLQARENGTNACYIDYLNAEEDISKSGPKTMSVLTRTLLSNIDYAFVKKRRNENYKALCEGLNEINEFHINTEAISPMVYPFLLKKDNLRNQLVSNKIYVSQWWKTVLENLQANNWEKYISKYLLPLPIDQRYSHDDMKKIIYILKYLIDCKRQRFEVIGKYEIKDCNYFGPLGRAVNISNEGVWIKIMEGFLIVSELRNYATKEIYKASDIIPIGYRFKNIKH